MYILSFSFLATWCVDVLLGSNLLMAAANGFVISLSGCVIALSKPGDLVPPRRRWRAGVLKPMKKVKRRLSTKQQDPSPSLPTVTSLPKRWKKLKRKPMEKVKRPSRLVAKQKV